jgi:hypothetical protein
MADRTPHASKIAFYIFWGPGHVMGDEPHACFFFLLNADVMQGERISLLLSKRVDLRFDLIGDMSS